MPELSVIETRMVSLGALIWEGKPQQRHTWNGAGQALAAVSAREPTHGDAQPVPICRRAA